MMKFSTLNLKKIIPILVLSLFSCEKSESPTEVALIEAAILEYEITGGEAGIFQKTKINENGIIYFTHFIYSNGNFEISTALSSQKHDSLMDILMENNFWNLSDKYSPKSPVQDGLSFSMHYQTKNKAKNVFVEAGADIPIEIKNIYRTLEQTNQFILSNPDCFTLVIPWNKQSTVKKWPFSECVKLYKQVYHYNEISCANEILDYFTKIKKEIGYHVFYWDNNSLYEIYNGGENSGYFNAHRSYPIKLLNQEFNLDFSELSGNGMVIDQANIDKFKNVLNVSTVFIINELKDNGTAIKVDLIPGKFFK